jgi:hypothetical protein
VMYLQTMAVARPRILRRGRQCESLLTLPHLQPKFMWASISYVNYTVCETYIYKAVRVRYFNAPLLRFQAFSAGKTKTSTSLVCVSIKKNKTKVRSSALHCIFVLCGHESLVSSLGFIWTIYASSIVSCDFVFKSEAQIRFCFKHSSF